MGVNFCENTQNLGLRNFSALLIFTAGVYEPEISIS